jgi:hypothetical protein
MIEDLWYSIYFILPPQQKAKHQIIDTPSVQVSDIQDSKS